MQVLWRSGAHPDVSIYERRGFECGWSECGVDGLEGPDAVHTIFVSGPASVIWLAAGDTPIDVPLGAIQTDLSLCALERAKHSHTRLSFEPQGV